MKSIIEYVPQSKRQAIYDSYVDADGMWIILNDGWEATRMDYGCHTIHEDTISELKWQIAGIQKIKEA